MPNLEKHFEKLLTLHNHICPRQVLGLRMGLYAGEALGLDLPQTDKRLFVFVESDGCFADGVMVATGCSLGHRTLHHMDFGKVAATFVDTRTGKAIRIAPRPNVRKAAALLFPDAKSRWHAQLQGYQAMSAPDLFRVDSVVLSLSLDKLISKPGVRTVCEVCGEEIINEREIVVDNQALCHSCAGDSYYHCADYGENRELNQESWLLLEAGQ